MNTAVMQLETCANKGYQRFELKKVYIMMVIRHKGKTHVITGYNKIHAMRTRS